MLQFFANLFRQLLPKTGKVGFLNRYQFRALKPTWPVALSIIFLSLAFWVAGQGRAIIKYTASEAGLDWVSLLSFSLLTVHGIVMMYTAFMLSAVTRRSYLDSHYTVQSAVPSDPVDPSISLRMRYAYCCGVVLPLQFLLMSIWFQCGLEDANLWIAIALGLGVTWLYSKMIEGGHHFIAYKLARFNAVFEKPSLIDRAAYQWWQAIAFLTDPRSSLAQSLIVGLGGVLIWLTLSTTPASGGPNYLVGAWMFYAVFFVLHMCYRMFRDRIVRLHHGHTARYIVIDPNVDNLFRYIRLLSLVLIPALLWWADFVQILGPLGVGLFGTLWITLFFSGLVESSARHARADSLREREREENTFSLKSLLLIGIVALLIVELAISVAETFRFRPAFTLEMLLLGAMLGVLLFSRMFWPENKDFILAMNRLPSSAVLAPILLLSLGEAHHIHRLPKTDVAAQGKALPIDRHAAAWLETRWRADPDQPVTAIIALAEGGGIRAGAHAGYYLTALDEQLRRHCKSNGDEPLCAREADTKLTDLLYTVSGVSGGAIGSAVYLAALADENRYGFDRPDEDRDALILAALSADYLAPLFAGLFGSDLLTTVFPAQLPDRIYGLFDKAATDTPILPQTRGVHDRADFFERRLAWIYEDALDKRVGADRSSQTKACELYFGNDDPTLDQPLEAVARCASAGGYTADPGPIALFSTFYETGGYLMATSNVDIPQNQSGARCGEVPIVQQMMGRTEAFGETQADACGPRQQSLPLSTAAHLSARFPGSNPTGVIETRFEDGRWKRHFFVDGGYMDNSGALAALEAFKALRDAARDRDIPVRVIVLHLHTISVPEYIERSDDTATGPRSVPRATKQAEITTVPMAVLKARMAASQGPISLLCNGLYDYTDDTPGGPYPLGECGEIFERQIITEDQVQSIFTNDAFSAAMPLEIINSKAPDIPCDTGPVDRARFQAIPLNIPTDGANGIVEAAWIPMPLEIASRDRQRNAIPALLGWTLLDETTNAIRAASRGATETSLNQMLNVSGAEQTIAACRADTQQSARLE